MLKKIYQITILPYTIFLLYLMFFGFGRTMMDTNIVRLSPIYSTYIFVQQKILINDYKMLVVNLIGNIVMFVPFGFLGWIIPKFKNLKILLFSFLSVLVLVEALQYFTRLGVFDLDDLLLNSLGVCIGFWLSKKMDSEKFPKNNQN